MSKNHHNIEKKVKVIKLETNSILIFVGCIIFLFVVGKFFILPLKTIAKLIVNSIIGALLITIINLVGGIFNFHIGLNLITSIIVGILGVPRCHTINYYETDINIKN